MSEGSAKSAAPVSCAPPSSTTFTTSTTSAYNTISNPSNTPEVILQLPPDWDAGKRGDVWPGEAEGKMPNLDLATDSLRQAERGEDYSEKRCQAGPLSSIGLPSKLRSLFHRKKSRNSISSSSALLLSSPPSQPQPKFSSQVEPETLESNSSIRQGVAPKQSLHRKQRSFATRSLRHPATEVTPPPLTTPSSPSRSSSPTPSHSPVIQSHSSPPTMSETPRSPRRPSVPQSWSLPDLGPKSSKLRRNSSHRVATSVDLSTPPPTLRRRPSIPEVALEVIASFGRRSLSQSRSSKDSVSDAELDSWRRMSCTRHRKEVTEEDMEVLDGETKGDDVLVIGKTPASPLSSGITFFDPFDSAPLSLPSKPLSISTASPLKLPPTPPSSPPLSSAFSKPPLVPIRPPPSLGLQPPPRPKKSPSLTSRPPRSRQSSSSSTEGPGPSRRLISSEAWRQVSLSASIKTGKIKGAGAENVPPTTTLQTPPDSPDQQDLDG